jgi:hypothetical protein
MSSVLIFNENFLKDLCLVLLAFFPYFVEQALDHCGTVECLNKDVYS